QDQGVEEVFFRTGSSFIQLLGDLGPDTPLGRFLARRGEGLHHVAYRVRGIEEALYRLRAAGVPLIDEAPRSGSRGTRIAFVHPKGFRGVLNELVQAPCTMEGFRFSPTASHTAFPKALAPSAHRP